ncbi:hypothetical protein J4462_00910 [Candidatus Pacearchaeota archaeon]|nr:hypothetical protein [Candidatus Pacearchaeota archaeon]
MRKNNLLRGLSGLILGGVSGCPVPENIILPETLPTTITVYEEDIKERSTLFEFDVKGPKPAIFVEPMKGDGGALPPFNVYVDCQPMAGSLEQNCSLDLQDNDRDFYNEQEWAIRMSTIPSELRLGAGIYGNNIFGLLTAPIIPADTHVVTVRYGRGQGNSNLTDRIDDLENGSPENDIVNGNEDDVDNGDDDSEIPMYVAGDGVCERGLGENLANSPIDCLPYNIGDGICDRSAGENYANSSVDCLPYTVGDGICASNDGETFGNSPQDCAPGNISEQPPIDIIVTPAPPVTVIVTPPAVNPPQTQIACRDNADCGSESVLEKFCRDGAVVERTKQPYCSNAGTGSSICSNRDTENVTVRPMGEVCVDGDYQDIASLLQQTDLEITNSDGIPVSPLTVTSGSSRDYWVQLIIPAALVPVTESYRTTVTDTLYTGEGDCLRVLQESVGPISSVGTLGNRTFYEAKFTVGSDIGCTQQEFVRAETFFTIEGVEYSITDSEFLNNE